MSEPRDTILEGRKAIVDRATAHGIDTDAITQEQRDPRTTHAQLLNTLNSTLPTPGRQRFQVDFPPEGAFDGVNQDYTLSRQALSAANIAVFVVTQGTGTMSNPQRTTNPTPVAGTWYYDAANNLIRLGLAPGASDNVAVAYLTRG